MSTQKRIRHSGTAYNVRSVIRTAIDHAANYTRLTQRPIEEFSAEVGRAKERLGYSRLSLRDQEFLDGYRAAVWNGLWAFADWRVYWRGAWYYSVTAGSYPDRHAASHGTARPASEITAGTWCEVDTERSAHFWVGSDKPFTAATGANPSTSAATGETL